MMKKLLLILLLFALLFSAAACAANETEDKNGAKDQQTFKIGAIPDQDAAELNRRFGEFAQYLSEKTGLQVEYIPSVDYSALVTAFEREEIDLAWFGGLTGVQARSLVPAAEAIAQRPRDEEFHSVFITQKNLDVEKLEDLKGLTFTFGSESSTSGHLMPRYFLMQAGVDPTADFNGQPNFSGSHDKTWKLVESGAFQAGALNEAVWESAVEEGIVDLEKVKVFYTTPSYYDYNWTINDVDQKFGVGTKKKIKEVLLTVGEDQNEFLKLFQTDKFIETKNENYEAIRSVAEELGIIK